MTSLLSDNNLDVYRSVVTAFAVLDLLTVFTVFADFFLVDLGIFSL